MAGQSDDERLAKFRDCAGRVLPEDAVGGVLVLLEGLESVTDVSPLMRLIG